MLNNSIRYHNYQLFCDDVAVQEIAAQAGTPVYIYSLKRAVANLRHIQSAFAELNPHIHYSAKANANLTILKTLIQAGAGIDAVSAGEIQKALLAGAKAEDIVFAGVGKTHDELAFALEKGVGWFNVENVAELQWINDLAAQQKRTPVQVALRLNPDIQAKTHRYIATGHKGAKFGLPAETVRELFAQQSNYPNVRIAGIHIHIGSQLHDTEATQLAVEMLLELITPYPHIRNVNIGGGLPVAYSPNEPLPSWENFAGPLTSMLKGYQVMLEPGRSIIADAGILVASVLYTKEQAGQRFLIVDGSMTELLRPALYEAHHEIVPVLEQPTEHNYEIVGPVCETTDALGHDVALPHMYPGDLLAVLTTGAYGMAMASNYNQRLRPPEIVIAEDGQHWQIARRRETWDDLFACEQQV